MKRLTLSSSWSTLSCSLISSISLLSQSTELDELLKPLTDLELPAPPLPMRAEAIYTCPGNVRIPIFCMFKLFLFPSWCHIQATLPEKPVASQKSLTEAVNIEEPLHSNHKKNEEENNQHVKILMSLTVNVIVMSNLRTLYMNLPRRKYK